MRDGASVVRWVAFASAILNTLVAGSIAVFALYAPQLQSHLHYTSLQVNTIGIAGQLGLYLTVPFLGIICDNKGPRIVCAYTAVLAFPAYLVASLAYTNRWQPWVLICCYVCLGSATVGLYLSAISTVAKNHPDSRGFAMAAVTASFGLSSLWETQVADRLYRSPVTGDIDIRALWLSFGVLMSLVGVISAFTLRVVPPSNTARFRRFSHSAIESDDDEEATDDEQGNDERTALLSHSAILEPSDKLSPTDRMKAFLADHSSWWYFLAFVLLAGPGEVFTNNLGSMFTSLEIATVHGSSASSQVSIFALSSTIGRLLFGALCDLPSKSPITTRMLVLISTAVLTTLGFAHLSAFSTPATFWLSSACIGAGYGGLFTAYPAIISIVWGTENFATFWGCLATAPAVGSTAFGILYAKFYDQVAERQQELDLCHGRTCFQASTAWFASSNLLGVGILVAALFIWRRRFSTEY